jgi:hypothetical protein
VLQLLRDLKLLERSVANRSPALFQIERPLFRIAAFERPLPYASEWYALYEYALGLVERLAVEEPAPSMRVRRAYQRVAQFVRENDELVIRHACR